MINFNALQLFALANTDKTILETVMMWSEMHGEALAMNEAFDAARAEDYRRRRSTDIYGYRRSAQVLR